MKKWLIVGTVAVLTLMFSATVASADHSWGSYHWEQKTAGPLQLVLGDNLSAPWNSHLAAASDDWNVSAVLDNSVAPGSVSSSACGPDTGEVEICADDYGNNGWLGIAGIWVTRGKNKHITKGYVQLNDYYFNQASYNTDDWRQLVTCQEVGHIFGLAHQDESFNNANLGTCMDYTSSPAGNTSPNAHDYEQLELIYAHDHGSDGGGKPDKGNNGNGKGKPNNAGLEQSEWGRAIHSDPDGRPDVFELVLTDGSKLITHVTWAR